MRFAIKLDNLQSLSAHAMITTKRQKTRFSIIYKVSRIDSNHTFSICFGLCISSSLAFAKLGNLRILNLHNNIT